MKLVTNKEMNVNDNSSVITAPIITVDIEKTTVLETGNYFVPTPSCEETNRTLFDLFFSNVGLIAIVGFIAAVILLSL